MEHRQVIDEAKSLPGAAASPGLARRGQGRGLRAPATGPQHQGLAAGIAGAAVSGIGGLEVADHP